MATTLAHTLPAKPLGGGSQPPRPLQPRSLAPSHAALAAQPPHVPTQHLPPRPPSAFPSPSPSPAPTSAAAPTATTGVVGIASPQSSVPFPSTSRCSHLPQALETGTDQQLERFSLAVRWSLKLASEHHQAGKRRKLPAPKCSSCHLALRRAMLCLDCATPLCTTAEGAGHVHAHSTKHRHSLFWDLHSCSVWCAGCSDYVYHPSVEKLVALETEAFQAELKAGNEAGAIVKRKRVTPSAWKTSSLSTTAIENVLPRGLRNLGQTCYMSVVLQAFLSNPILRSFFLSDRHNRSLCERTQLGEKPCLLCEMDLLFSECCSSSASAFGPTNFLHTMWQSSTELSGYAQQDAHEFLISTLNLLHSSSPGSTNLHCTCIAHSTFAGQLRSEVRCGRCGNVTNSTDPFLDLSLDLRGGAKVGLPAGANTLADCLTRFTSPEQLPPKEYTCGTCGDTAHTASKQLSIQNLPPVLCIQLKRFEHVGGSHKVDTPIRYPLKLNMRRYMSTTLATASPGLASPGPDSAYEYELSSLVAHEGTLTNGHYTSICRGPDDFWVFDDDKVRRAPIAEVLNAKAYLLIYTKK
ncbi:hypothetical protein BCR35DRAFT_296635 [Leucosporidium creatinivorum]|uniref:Ubiquitin carboxyl-terminal hydrolase n=1 Tax=Leucosporidium creatinivorum TaxID=106004 RepID=A0A1Y2D618_9BASI|nr:hypothetical protein BCR35DRAFT_296635 [Leucosporidium creatinivorum]